MSKFVITKAKRLKLNARIGLTGATNTGKTYSALRIAAGLLISEGLVDEKGNPDWSKIAILDTERGRSLFYANDGTIGEFLHVDFRPPYTPADYIEAVKYIEDAGVRVCIIDSLSHAWNGVGGVLDIVSEKTAASKHKNSFNEGWGGKDGGTAIQNKMVDAILSSNMHIICTFRQKMEYVQQPDLNKGGTRIEKLGVKPIQRDDLEYEFDITLKLNNDHTAEIIKNTVKFLGDKEETLPVITEEFGKLLGEYLNKGLDPVEYENQLKDKLLTDIKELIGNSETLASYTKAKCDGNKLRNLSNAELRSLISELETLKGM